MSAPVFQLRGRHWLVATATALALHGSLALLLLEPERSGAFAAGKGGIRVALGPAGGTPGSASETVPEEAAGVEAPDPEASESGVPEAQEVAPPAESEALPPEVVQQAESVTVPEPPVVEAVEAEVAPAEVPLYAPVETVEAEAPEVEEVQVTEAVPPEPQQETAAVAARAIPPKPQTKPRRQPPPEEAAEKIAEVEESAVRETQTAALDPAAESAATTAAAVANPAAGDPNAAAPSGSEGKAGEGAEAGTGSAESSDGGGIPGMMADYEALLLAWLEKHREYPRRARLRRQEGTALLRFVIDSEGRVLDFSIERSSGHRLLDKEVEETLQRAAPLPPPPKQLQQARLEYHVPVNFNLH